MGVVRSCSNALEIKSSPAHNHDGSNNENKKKERIISPGTTGPFPNVLFCRFSLVRFPPPPGHVAAQNHPHPHRCPVSMGLKHWAADRVEARPVRQGALGRRINRTVFPPEKLSAAGAKRPLYNGQRVSGWSTFRFFRPYFLGTAHTQNVCHRGGLRKIEVGAGGPQGQDWQLQTRTTFCNTWCYVSTLFTLFYGFWGAADWREIHLNCLVFWQLSEKSIETFCEFHLPSIERWAEECFVFSKILFKKNKYLSMSSAVFCQKSPILVIYVRRTSRNPPVSYPVPRNSILK